MREGATVATVSVSVEGRVLRLSNLDKDLYPQVGFTKGEVIDYYVAVAPYLLPRLAGRPLTLRRYPDGAGGEGFYEKHAARHAPSWVRTVMLPTRHTQSDPTGPTETEYVLLEDLPGLVWAANLAALELHVPQWTMAEDGGRGLPDLMVFDLDPGPPADIVACCRVAELLHEALAEDGLPAWAKTSGSKGMQLYARPRLHRLVPEPPGQDHDRGLLTACPAGAHRVHAADLGRGARVPAGGGTGVHRVRRAQTAGHARRPAGRPGHRALPTAVRGPDQSATGDH